VQRNELVEVLCARDDYSARFTSRKGDATISEPAMKRVIVFFVVVAAGITFANGQGVAAPEPGEIPGDLPFPTFQFTATLSGTNEIPPNNSPATGTGTFTLVANVFAYQVFMPLPFVPTGAQIHGPALPGQNTNALFALDGPMFVTPVPGGGDGGYAFTGSRTVSGAEVAQLFSGMWYVNVFSAAFPDGELRGQILPPSPDSDGDGVPDAQDYGRNTPPDAVVNTNGATVAQACSCNNMWNPRRLYVRCVVRTAIKFQRAGLCTLSERRAIVRAALHPNRH
jgi:hypothetical protein